MADLRAAGPDAFRGVGGRAAPPYVLAIDSDGASGQVPRSIYIDTDGVRVTLNRAQSGGPLGEEVSRRGRRAEQAEALIADKDRQLQMRPPTSQRRRR